MEPAAEVLAATEHLKDEMGAVGLSHALILAGIGLMANTEGSARAWEMFRDLLAGATENARKARFTGPRPID